MKNPNWRVAGAAPLWKEKIREQHCSSSRDLTLRSRGGGYTDRERLVFFFRYLTPYRRELFQLVLGMLTASILQLILPFLTQSMVDTGIRDSNLSFITLILIAQLVIFVAKLSVDFIRSWILLHVNTRINIALISDFLPS